MDFNIEVMLQQGVKMVLVCEGENQILIRSLASGKSASNQDENTHRTTWFKHADGLRVVYCTDSRNAGLSPLRRHSRSDPTILRQKRQ
jgi:pyruvate/2-oxoglutarate/acetoin dehydrogenase E1 component